ncbi:MAG: TlpA family protein disulfide reductase [Deltaproteobacteria bacterium]|nr:TlpA family protein disulfide reductase [Deltaproteobacteria bacterium]
MKGGLILALLLCLAFSTPLAYGLEKGLLRSLGIQELRQEAPDFTLINPDGKKISLSDYKGKVVILHIWATWCKPCKEEFPLFEKVYQRFKDKDVIFLPIAIDPKAGRPEIDAFAKKLGVSFSVYLAKEGDITDRYWTWGVPATYFIDKKGWIAGRAIGPRDWASDSINNLINALLEEK